MRLVATFVQLTARWQSICLTQQIFPHFYKIFLPNKYALSIWFTQQIFQNVDKYSLSICLTQQIFPHFDKIFLPNKHIKLFCQVVFQLTIFCWFWLKHETKI